MPLTSSRRIAGFAAGLLAGLLAVLLAGLAPATAGAADRRLEFGGEVRVRGYELQNVWDRDDDQEWDRWSVLRHRLQLFAALELEREVRAYVRLANQNYGEGVTAAAADRWEVDNRSDKVFVDNAWVEIGGALGLPLEARVGRQDVVYGSGFVLFDGQSQYASTSAYLDGARLRVAPAAGLWVDLLYFKDQENRPDDAAGDDLTLSGVYLTLKQPALRGATELYGLRRQDQALGRDVRLLGARVAHAFGWGLDYALEGGLQRGHAACGIDQEAWGLKTEIGFAPKGLPWGMRPFAGLVGLSGDDAATAATSERWDVFYGGWPQFGDLLAWTYVNVPGNAIAGYDPGYAAGSSTAGEAVYSNLLIPTAGLVLKPATRLGLTVSWSPLRAERVAAGSDRLGDYWQLAARYRYSEQLAFGLYAAAIEPGEAFGPAADRQHEIYWELDLDF